MFFFGKDLTSIFWPISGFIPITVQPTVVCSRPLCIYCGIFSPKKKWVFPRKKYFPKKIKKFLPFFYATFQCGRYNVFKFYLFYFFAHKKLKKPPSKVAHNRPKPFIPQPSPTHSQQPKIDFSYHKNVPPTICSLICVGHIVKCVNFLAYLENRKHKLVIYCHFKLMDWYHTGVKI